MDRHKVIPVVYILFRDEFGKILFLRRANTGFEDGRLSLVAGYVEVGEDFKTAAIREAREEVGVDLVKDNLNFLHLQVQNAADGDRIDVFFEALGWGGKFLNAEPEKCSELVWADFEDVQDDLIPFVRDVLVCIEDKICYSEFNY